MPHEENSVDIKPSPEEVAEIDNAVLAAEDFARDGHTNRRCLRCGGDLVMDEVGSSYAILCRQEGREIFASRGL